MRLASRPVAVRSTLPSELGTAEEGEGERSIVRLLFEYEWGGGRVAEDHVVDADVAPGTRGGIHDFEDRLASLKPAHVERLGPHAVGVPPGGGALHLAVRARDCRGGRGRAIHSPAVVRVRMGRRACR